MLSFLCAAGVECGAKRNVDAFDLKLNQACRKVLESLQRYKLQSVRTDKLWSAFHKFSLQEGHEICRQCDTAINLKAGDIFWQLLMEKRLLAMYRSQTPPAIDAHTSSSRHLSTIEENAIFYTGGYVIRKLINKYSRNSSQKSVAYLQLLGEMASKFKDQRTSSVCSKWTEIVDRGGLTYVSSIVYDLFMFLEMTVDEGLTSIFRSKGKGIEKVRRERLDWLCYQEEVQLVWSMLTNEDDSTQDLLKEIASVWITTRGYSKARIVKEQFKKAKASGTKGKHSLRKELKKNTTKT